MNSADAYQRMQQLLACEVGSAKQVEQLQVLSAAPVTTSLLLGCAQALRERMVSFPCMDVAVCDIVGTGGDGLNTYHISTAASLLLAAADVPVAKHGNRASSSRSGAADVLEKLGVNITAAPVQMADCLRQTGWAFLYAPIYHPELGKLAAARKAIGKRTVINLLGPLISPAKPEFMLLGVSDQAHLLPIAEALYELGTQHAWVVAGADGMDELSICGHNQVCSLQDGAFEYFSLCPKDVGLPSYPLQDLQADPDADCALALQQVLQGKESAYADAVLFNAAAAYHLARNVSLAQAMAALQPLLRSGAAFQNFTKITEQCPIN